MRCGKHRGVMATGREIRQAVMSGNAFISLLALLCCAAVPPSLYQFTLVSNLNNFCLYLRATASLPRFASVVQILGSCMKFQLVFELTQTDSSRSRTTWFCMHSEGLDESVWIASWTRSRAPNLIWAIRAIFEDGFTYYDKNFRFSDIQVSLV